MLIAPSANRVYADAAVALTVAEIEVFARTVLSGHISDVAATAIAGVPYAAFTGDLTRADVAMLANASTRYALYAREGDLLRPVELTPRTNYYRRLQHEAASRLGLVSQSKGEEPYRRVVIYPG